MSAQVIFLEQAWAARRPHEAGELHCLACDHSWIGTAPAGQTWMDCPRCGRKTAEWAMAENGALAAWACLCGCTVFRVRKTGIFCLHCGEEQFGL